MLHATFFVYGINIVYKYNIEQRHINNEPNFSNNSHDWYCYDDSGNRPASIG